MAARNGGAHWSTPAIDRRIVALKSDGVFLNTICGILWTEFHIVVTKGMVLRRTRTLRLAPNDKVCHSGAADPPTRAWRADGSDAEFASLWLAGTPSRVMAAHWHVNLDRIHRRRCELNLPPRPGGPLQQGQHARPTTPKPPPKPHVVPSPTHQLIPAKSASGRTGSAFMFRGLNTPPKGKTDWRPGQCHWPLTCDEPASHGNYCFAHRQKLRAA